MGLLDIIRFREEQKARQRQEEEALRLSKFYGDYQKDPNAPIPQLSDPAQVKGLQDFVSQQADKRGADAAFRELAPFLQPSLSRKTLGKMPTQQEFIADASQWAQGQGIDPRYSIPAIEQMQGLKQFQSVPKKDYQTINGVYGIVDDKGFTPVPGAPPPKADYEIKQNESGEFFYVPKTPGGSTVPVGLKGKTPGPQVIVSQGENRENKLFEQAVSSLPKDLEEATNARRNIGRLDQAIGIAEKYGNDVAGFGGQFQKAMGAVLSPLGMNTAKMDAAQILDSLTKEGAGSLRAAIIGPGQVSNYEQQIMQQVSGGRMSSAEGVIAILEHHRKTNEETISGYKRKLDTITKKPGYEEAKDLYPAPQFKPRKYRDTFAPVTDDDIQWD